MVFLNGLRKSKVTDSSRSWTKEWREIDVIIFMFWGWVLPVNAVWTSWASCKISFLFPKENNMYEYIYISSNSSQCWCNDLTFKGNHKHLVKCVFKVYLRKVLGFASLSLFSVNMWFLERILRFFCVAPNVSRTSAYFQ